MKIIEYKNKIIKGYVDYVKFFDEDGIVQYENWKSAYDTGLLGRKQFIDEKELLLSEYPIANVRVDGEKRPELFVTDRGTLIKDWTAFSNHYFKSRRYYPNSDYPITKLYDNLYLIHGINTIYVLPDYGEIFNFCHNYHLSTCRLAEGDSIDCFYDLLKNPHSKYECQKTIVSKIDRVYATRETDNTNEKTFDFIHCDVFLVSSSTYEDVLDEYSNIVNSVVCKIEKSRAFKKFHIPVNFLALQNVMYSKSFNSLSFIFELKPL